MRAPATGRGADLRHLINFAQLGQARVAYAIHVLLSSDCTKDVDARDERGHDETA